MLNTFFEDKKDLLTIEEFSESIKTTKDEVLKYIQRGVLFPLVEIKSGTHVRRIPSLITEFFSEVLEIPNADAYSSLYNNKNNYIQSEMYNEYYKQLKNFSKKSSKDNKDKKYFPPDKMMPWESDIIITENSFVYAQPEIILDVHQYGKSYLPQYITNKHPRFEIAGIIGEDLYMKFLQSDYKIRDDKILFNDREMDIGIGNRALGGTYSEKSILYLPDDKSINYAAYKSRQDFPLPVHLAINILQLGEIAFNKCGTNYEKLSTLITKKLISLLAEKDKISFNLFNDLVILGSICDRWVPIGSIYFQNNYLDCPDFTLPFYNHSIYINQAQYYNYKNLTGWGPYTLVDFRKTILDQFKLRSYMIYNKYLYYIFKNINDTRYTDKTNSKIISHYLDKCFLDAEKDLANDMFFCENAAHTGAGGSDIDDHNKPYASKKTGKYGKINILKTKEKILQEGKHPATELEPINFNDENSAN